MLEASFKYEREAALVQPKLGETIMVMVESTSSY
jgi:hypothetical protein